MFLIVSFAILKEKKVEVGKVVDSLSQLLTTFINQNQEEGRFNSIFEEKDVRKATILTSARDPNSQTAYKYFLTNASPFKEDS